MIDTDLIIQLKNQLIQRQDFVIHYNNENNVTTSAQSYGELCRLDRGYVYFEARFAALTKELEEFLFLGGEQQ